MPFDQDFQRGVGVFGPPPSPLRSGVDPTTRTGVAAIAYASLGNVFSLQLQQADPVSRLLALAVAHAGTMAPCAWDPHQTLTWLLPVPGTWLVGEAVVLSALAVVSTIAGHGPHAPATVVGPPALTDECQVAADRRDLPQFGDNPRLAVALTAERGEVAL
jgi:hypothetical protein